MDITAQFCSSTQNQKIASLCPYEVSIANTTAYKGKTRSTSSITREIQDFVFTEHKQEKI